VEQTCVRNQAIKLHLQNGFKPTSRSCPCCVVGGGGGKKKEKKRRFWVYDINKEGKSTANTTRKQEGSGKVIKPASCLIQLAALAECDIRLRTSRLKLRIFKLLGLDHTRRASEKRVASKTVDSLWYGVPFRRAF